MSLLLEYAQRLEDSDFATSLHESLYAFPLLEGTHLLGLALSVGLLAVIDLKLLGLVFPHNDKQTLLRQLRPWVLGGFAVTFATGGVLFASEAAAMLASPAFLFKLAFIVLAGINAAVFEWQFRHQLKPQPYSERLAGGISLALWALVIISGRLIPYWSGPHV